jgi:Glutaminase
MHAVLFFFILSMGPQVQALPHGVSAVRPSGVHWKSVARQRQPILQKTLRGTSVDEAKPLPEVDFNRLTRWKDLAQIKERFEYIRDIRFIPEPLNPKALRRSTWLYPDDGCYARASLINENLFYVGAGEVEKIFAFGNLLVKTKNSPSGVVSWWYHVAPIVTDGKDKYVLDPALEPKKPLLLRDWLSRIGDPNQIVISLCKSSSYTPYSSCQGSTFSEDDVALDDQIFFLSLERHRLQELGRNADEELGDHPPWML